MTEFHESKLMVMVTTWALDWPSVGPHLDINLGDGFDHGLGSPV